MAGARLRVKGIADWKGHDMDRIESAREVISGGRAVLGIELGSTRIKAVLTGPGHEPLATGGQTWENQLKDNVWTYDLEEALAGLRGAYAQMAAAVRKDYGVIVRKLAGIGISGMMHGYLAFDREGQLLAPFRTWRNTMTGEASERLSSLFKFAVPQRFSIAHLYQAMLNREAHVPKIRFLTTLAGYAHWQLTGEKVLGVGDASGMFPIGSDLGYDRKMLAQFEALSEKEQHPWKLLDILPRIKLAGEEAGTLTPRGAGLLDPEGNLEPGIPLCPPEGDAGTGMVATNAVAPRTGNVSAGTSIFAMIVLEKGLSEIHSEIDIVATPGGSPVAMVHCNNCTTDLNTWVNLLLDFEQAAGMTPDRDQAYRVFFDAALKGDADAGGLVSIGYYSGEHITGFEKGCPLLLHPPESKFSFANLARSILFSSLATLKIGMEVLEKEKVRIDRVLGHGGLYKTGEAGQRLTAAALQTPVSVMDTAGEGGAWGAALLAGYMANRDEGETLTNYLDHRVFSRMKGSKISPDPRDVKGFLDYMARFKAHLHTERAAVDHMQPPQS